MNVQSKRLIVNKDDIALAMCFFMLKTSIFFNSMVCRIMAVLLLIYLFIEIKRVWLQSQNFVMFFAVLFVIISTYNTHLENKTMIYHRIIDAVMFLETLMVFKICFSKNSERSISVLYYCSSFYVLLNLLLLIIFPNGIEQTVTEKIWLLRAGKFSTSYLCLLWIAFVAMRNPQKKGEIFWAFVISLFTTLKMGCYTGLIAWMVMALLFVLPPERRKIFLDYRTIIIGLAILYFGVIISHNFLNIGFVRRIVENLLGKDLTLTGRTQIYDILFETIARKPWTGYGYGNTVIINRLGYGNAQNGVFELAITYGVVASAVFILMLITIIKRQSTVYGPAFVAMLSLLVCSVVEVTFTNSYFYIALALIYALMGEIKKERVQRVRIVWRN